MNADDTSGRQRRIRTATNMETMNSYSGSGRVRTETRESRSVMLNSNPLIPSSLAISVSNNNSSSITHNEDRRGNSSNSYEDSSQLTSAAHDVNIQGDSRNTGASTYSNPQISELLHPCCICGRSFSTKSGLGVHFRRAHPDESDRAKVRTDKKARWNDEEMSLLACTEAELTHRGGIRFMNHALHERFVHRSVEAIKKMRQRNEYKVKVQTYLSRLDSIPGPSNVISAWVPNQQEIDDSEAGGDIQPVVVDTPGEVDSIVIDPIQTYLLNLSDLNADNQCATYLNSIVHSVVENDKDHVLHRLSGYLDEVFPTDLRPRQRARPMAPQTLRSRRLRRKHEYAKVQRNWRRHTGRCIKSILDGMESFSQPPRDLMEPYWRTMFESSEETGPYADDLKRYNRGNVWYPIEIEEIIKSKPSLSTSPGPDGITSRQIRAISWEVWKRIFNLMMWCGKIPGRLRMAKTIFLPKKQKPELPEDFRPISLSSVILRWFHSILARRISKCIDFDQRQKGFMPTDGCAENTTMLDLLLRDHHQEYKSCFIAVLDVSKAFDSVSHKAIFETLKSYGLPQVLVDYVQHVYSSTTIRLSGDTWESERMIVPGKGVRQGDPMSPVLFNLVIDRLIRKLPPEIGCRIGNGMTNIAAYADDLVIWSSTSQGLQKLLDITSEFLQSCGLRLNSSKCLSVSIQGQPKQKRSVVVRKEFLIGGQVIPALKRTEEWKYLGVTFTADGKTKLDLKVKLIEKLDRLTRAPLKPQQRLFALRSVLIPQLYHVLTLGNVMIGCLNGIDKTIRRYVRKWLHLPDDIPIAFLHASVDDGGLGVIALRWQAPLLRLNRLRSLQLPLPNSGIRTADTFMAGEVAKVERRLRVDDRSIQSREDLRKFWADRLHASIDGFGLKHATDHKQANRWVREASRLLNGRDYINCIKLRINALPTRSRCSRGRAMDKNCRAGCDVPETLNHIVQGCYRTKNARIARHDSVVEYVDRRLRARGFSTQVERRMQTIEGVRKPDIVAVKGEKIYVLDAQVVTDSRSLSDMHKVKADKYNNSDMIRALRQEYGHDQVHFGAITLNWRGIWCRESIRDLLRWGVIIARDSAVISTRVMIGGIASHRRFTGMVGRRRGIG